MNNIKAYPTKIKFKGVLFLLIFLATFAIINILVTLNAHYERSVNIRNQERLAINGINSVGELKQFISQYSVLINKFTTNKNIQSFSEKSTVLLNNLIAQVEIVRNSGISANDVNKFHESYQLINAATNYLIKLKEKDNTEIIALENQINLIEKYINDALSNINIWEKTLIQNYENASIKNDEGYTQLTLFQVFFLALVIALTLYSLVILYNIRNTYENIVEELYNHLPTDLPNLKQLREDFEENIKNTQGSDVYLFLVDTRAINIMVQTENQQDFTYVMKLIRDRIFDVAQQYMPKTGLYRYTEGMFALIAVEPTRDKITEVCRAILSKLQEPLEVRNRIIRLFPGIGVVAYPNNAKTFDEVIHHGLIALTYCKAEELKNYIVFSNEVEDNRRKRLAVLTRLYESLEKNEFEISYQPRKDCLSGSINCFEAFLRWKVGLVIYPADYFIPIAEEGGLSAKIDYWVMQAVGKHILKWREQNLPEIAIAINISSQFLQQEDFLQTVKDWLSEYKINPQQIIFEVSKLASPNYGTIATTAIDNALERISRMGIIIALDDFGSTPYSFADLVRFPINILKIDSLFVRGISKNYIAGQEKLDPQSAWTKALIDMAHQLNIIVVGEGVETITQNSLLTLWGCDQIQGEIYCPVIEAIKIPKLITKNINKLQDFDRKITMIKKVAEDSAGESLDLEL